MKQEIIEIISRVLEGTASRDEYQQLTAWVKQNEHHAKEFANYESLWLALDIIANKSDFSSAEGYQRLMNKASKGQSYKTISMIIKNYGKIAASVLFIVGLSLFTYWLGKESNNQNISFYELNTPKGSKSQLVLPDGTKIWLNAASKLRYPNRFLKDKREVFLEGEGYFDVAKDTKRPFIVHTSDINIRVLGTVFNVKSYANEGYIETTLVSGKVIIESSKQNKKQLAQLLPNEKAVYLKKNGQIMLGDKEQNQAEKIISLNNQKGHSVENIIISEKVNTSIYTAWKDNLLLFDNETFESIALKIERRYGAYIRFNNPDLKKYRFSGTFPEISIDRALNALQYASHFNYRIEGDSIFIGN